MRIRKPSSIVGRLSLAFWLTNGLTLFLTVIGFTIIVVVFSLRAFKQELESIAGLIATSGRAPLAFHDKEAGERALTALEANDGVKYAALIDPFGRVLSSYGTKTPDLTGVSLTSSNTMSWSIDRGMVVITQPVILDGDPVGTVLIAANLRSLYSQLKGILVLSAFITLIVAVTGSFVFMKLRGWVSQPIDSLRQVALRVSSTKDFSTRLKVENNDEISDLIRAFNVMLQNIEERDQGMRKAKDRAEKADQVKSAFLASISHELRTPLHAIVNISEELNETKLDTKQLDLLAIVRNASNALLSIINDILDFSKIEAGKLDLHASQTDLKKFLNQTVQMFSVLAAKKGVTIDLILAERVPTLILIDSGRLSQILVNLLGNALKFTDSGGKIVLSVKPGGSHGAQSQLLLFSVSDRGIGIPADKLEYIFEAFNQVENSRSARQGTGLGLAIAARLANLMGGKISVKSEIGVGSEFSFFVEYQQVQDTKLPIDQCNSPSDTNKFFASSTQLYVSSPPVDLALDVNSQGITNAVTILIVDDNEVNQMVAQRIVKKSGANALLASNGLEAVEKYCGTKIDLVLMDINMPAMDGLEATRKIREFENKHSQARTPVIAVSASIPQDAAQSCYEAGMDDILHKPFRPSELVELINRYTNLDDNQDGEHSTN